MVSMSSWCSIIIAGSLRSVCLWVAVLLNDGVRGIVHGIVHNGVLLLC